MSLNNLSRTKCIHYTHNVPAPYYSLIRKYGVCLKWMKIMYHELLQPGNYNYKCKNRNHFHMSVSYNNEYVWKNVISHGIIVNRVSILCFMMNVDRSASWLGCLHTVQRIFLHTVVQGYGQKHFFFCQFARKDRCWSQRESLVQY